MSYPLNNNTNTVRQVNQQHTWMKPGDLHLPRQTSISREQELQNKLKQTSLNPAAAAATAPTARNVNSDDFCKISPAELAAKRKEFGTFKFYLDNLDPLVSKRIERGIKIMGAVSVSSPVCGSISHLCYRHTSPSFQRNALISSPQSPFPSTKICLLLPGMKGVP